jgi:thioesterase domain-containing protein
LTANGKVNRNSLPIPESWGISARYIAPDTPEEILLCELVATLLGVQRVGLADNFFHLGGNSLMASRLAIMVRECLGRDVSVVTVFEHPVLGALARQIGLVTQTATAFDVLLPIRTGGSLPPLFCLHPGTGLCWPYTNLLRVTPDDQPIYAIQARGFAGDVPLPQSLDEIVNESLEEIRAIAPSGPYHLLGWSFGGIIAHMIATRLQSRGHEVARLLLFDSYPPNNLDQLPHTIESSWREIALGTNLVIPAGMLSDTLNAATVLTLAREQSHILGTFPLAQLHHLAVVLANNSILVPTAKLATFVGDITLFVARQTTAGLDRSDIGADAWNAFCRGSVRTVSVDAEHHQMLSPSALQQVIATLQ